MIDRREIIEAAKVLSLRPQVVDKDYVLGWILAGIYAHPTLARSFVFKGGTCLKKCYFETYRFSEDLDFTITDPGLIDESTLSEAFTEICDWVYRKAGIEVFPDRLRFDIYTNPRGEISCQGRFYYRGPVSPRGGSSVAAHPGTSRVHQRWRPCTSPLRIASASTSSTKAAFVAWSPIHSAGRKTGTCFSMEPRPIPGRSVVSGLTEFRVPPPPIRVSPPDT